MEENKDEKKEEQVQKTETPEVKNEEKKITEPVQEEPKQEPVKDVKEEKVENVDQTQPTPNPNLENTKKEKPGNEKKKKEKAPKDPTKKKHIGLIVSIVVIILAIIAGAIGAIVYCFVFASTEVDLSKYISFEIEGYEGYVSVSEEDVHIDEKALKKAIDDSKVSKKLISKLEDAITVEDNENLKNGNEVKVKIKLKESFLKDNKLKLKANEFTIKIDGLEETETVDLFKDLEFNVTGISPNLSLRLKNNSSDSFIKTVNYTMEDSEGHSNTYSLSELKNGDKVTITASYSDSSLQIAGYTVEKDTYEYTIENAPEYISKDTQLTESVQKSLTDKFESEIKSTSEERGYAAVSSVTEDEIEYDEEFTVSAPTLERLYLLISTSEYNSAKNKVYGIYKVTFTSKKTSKTYDYYYTVYTSNVVVEKEELYKGTNLYYTTSSEYGSDEYAKNADDAYTHFIDSEKDNFEIKKIK